MALATDGTYLYALFNTVDDPNASNPDYKAGTVVKLDVSGSTISEDSRIDVGKNAFTLEYYDNKLYVASLGGKQLENAYNPTSRLDVVSTSGTLSATTAFSASSTIPGDFRDITLSDSGDAYILTGYYTTNYATMTGKLYKTTAANINATTPNIGTVVQNINTAGFLWATLYDDVSPATYDRLWFVRGNQVDIYNPPPASTSATATTFTPANLGVYPANANLNGVSLLGSGTTVLTRKMRSFAPHAHLASQAMMAATELLEDDQQ